MERAAVSAATGVMSSVLGKLADLLLDEYKLANGVREDIRFLMSELEPINDLLSVLADLEELDALNKGWRDRMRELAYDIEFSTEPLPRILRQTSVGIVIASPGSSAKPPSGSSPLLHLIIPAATSSPSPIPPSPTPWIHRGHEFSVPDVLSVPVTVDPRQPRALRPRHRRSAAATSSPSLMRFSSPTPSIHHIHKFAIRISITVPVIIVVQAYIVQLIVTASPSTWRTYPTNFSVGLPSQLHPSST
ncbi:hypothetical protein HU200_016480 [Digitaria exilis]|uniref:Disease resistance N-terminal domain-containing protein n=1 Tax=Digitaria exilis TaxID=1010633 RepID=A0A835F8G8_9POAL|nr:hypothetical protein HU200_016480 [Digitaria exilis]